MQTYRPPQSQFVVGSFKDYTELTALNNINQNRQTVTNNQGTEQKYYLAEHIYDQLSVQGNPIATVLEAKRFDFGNELYARPDETNFNQTGAMDIMKNDPYVSSLISDISDTGTMNRVADQMLVDQVNNQTMLYTSQVTMAVCHDVMQGNELTKELVNQHYIEKIVEPLNHKADIQKDLAVQMVAMSDLKENILSDMRHIEFQQQFHNRLQRISGMNAPELSKLVSDVQNAQITYPQGLMDLAESSYKLAEKMPSLTENIYLPVRNDEIYGVLQRENIPFLSDSFKNEVSRAALEINTSFEDYLSQMQQTKEKPEKSLGNDLAQAFKAAGGDDSPSM